MAPVRNPTSLPRRIAIALLTLGLLTSGFAASAQDAASRSIAEVAADSVKNAAKSALSSAQDLTSTALALIGIRYKWGGTSPETGLDCSGLVRYVFQQVTGITLPRSARDLSKIGDKIAVEDLQPGDLVFFNTRRFAFSHVGIYLGDNRFVHAPRRGREVEIASLDSSFWHKRFNGARRMAGVLPELIPNLVSEAAAASVDPPASLAASSDPATAVGPPAPTELVDLQTRDDVDELDSAAADSDPPPR